MQKSIRAGIIGLAIVFLFMLVYYRMNGLAADLALALYVLLNLLVYKLCRFHHPAGIAGFLLFRQGWQWDANILVFERMKEELRRGRSVPERDGKPGISRPGPLWTFRGGGRISQT